MTRLALAVLIPTLAGLALAGCAGEPAATAPAASTSPSASTRAAATPAPAPAAATSVVAAPAGPRQPAVPYWSVQVAAIAGKAMALQTLDKLKDLPYARAEKRKSGYLIRAGAWDTRAEADAEVPALREKFGKGAVSVLQLQNPVDWLMPGGNVLPVAGAASPAPVTAAAPAEPAAAKTSADAAMRDAAAKLDAATRAALKGGAARKDHYTYAMDLAPLLLYAADRKDRTLYEQLLPAAQSLVLNSKDDPYAQGFVVTRIKDGAKPEGSDAGAMLWMARALWAGGEAFGRDDDKATARLILEGYARHAYEIQGIWLVRHRFDFASRTFTSTSLLADYHGDFLAQAEGAGEKARALVARAAGRAGLLRPMIQPEVGATYGGSGIVDAVAPNNLTPLADSCTAAAGVAGSNAALAQGVLAFATAQARKGALKAFYNVDTGASGGDAALPEAGLACLEGLASTLDDGNATGALDARFTAALRAQAKGVTLESAGPLLLAAQARGAF